MKYISVIILLITVFACSSTKKNTANKKDTKPISAENQFDMSLHTKMFLREFESEKKSANNDDFIPSVKLINKYGLKKVSDEYTISGFIKTNNKFQKDQLTLLKIKYGSLVNNIITVIIPLNSIDSFLYLKGIDYFEIGAKVELKN